MGFDDVDGGDMYEDTIWTALEHPKGFSMQLGFGFTYKTSPASMPHVGILRGIVHPKGRPDQVVFFAQKMLSTQGFNGMGLDASSLNMSDMELAATGEYIFVPLKQAVGNCSVLTNEQYRFVVKKGQSIDHVYFYR